MCHYPANPQLWFKTIFGLTNIWQVQENLHEMHAECILVVCFYHCYILTENMFKRFSNTLQYQIS
jgi:hypothetical protein